MPKRLGSAVGGSRRPERRPSSSTYFDKWAVQFYDRQIGMGWPKRFRQEQKIRTRGDFLIGFLSTGAVGLTVACGGPAAPSATSAPAAQPTTAAAAGAAPTQAAPAQAAGKPAAAGGAITFAIENDIIDFDPLISRAFVDRNAHYQIY